MFHLHLLPWYWNQLNNYHVASEPWPPVSGTLFLREKMFSLGSSVLRSEEICVLRFCVINTFSNCSKLLCFALRDVGARASFLWHQVYIRRSSYRAELWIEPRLGKRFPCSFLSFFSSVFNSLCIESRIIFLKIKM